MSNFSDREDRHLVRLAKGYEDRKERVAWSEVAAQMKYSLKSAAALRVRLSTLKRTHGKAIAAFPPWFFQPSPPRKQVVHGKARRVVAKAPPMWAGVMSPPLTELALETVDAVVIEDIQAPVARTAVSAITVDPTSRGSTSPSQPSSQTLMTQITETEVAPKTHQAVSAIIMAARDACVALEDIFKHVGKKDVRQPARQVERNVGEISPNGVTTITKVCNLTSADVFLDVGSGIGNIIAQVVLQTAVEQAIGIEIRSDIAPKSQELLQRYATMYPRLKATCVLEGDVYAFQEEPILASTTVLLANNFLFTPSTNLCIQRLSCQLPHLRLVLLCHQVCPRHKARCRNMFCVMWMLRETVSVASEFKASAHDFYVYERRNRDS